MAATASKPAPAWEAPGFRDDVAAFLADQFAGRPDVRQGKMFGHPAFSTGGKVFACAFGDGVALKLPPATIDRLADPAIVPFRPMGRPMGGWVQISRPDPVDYALDEGLFETAIAYVGEQAAQAKPAPRTRKRAAA
jgi:hypothetical protein